MRKITFELCAESIDACLAARDGGADRIELCSALSEGGLTPSHGLIYEAIRVSGLPVHVLLRPNGGGFVYTRAEFELMCEDLVHLQSLGASGVVLGVLHPDHSVDVERTRELVERASPLEVTFNRAFDHTASLDQALEDVIAAGCSRLLTSGGESDVVRGAKTLARLIALASGRIHVAVGGGLRWKSAATVAKVTCAEHFHGSLRRRVPKGLPAQREAGAALMESAMPARFVVAADDVRAMIEKLRNG